LLEPAALRLDSEAWIDSEEARVIAGRAFLAHVADSASPRRELIREERYYSAEGPTIALHHRECGVTTVHASTGEAHYRCDEPPPEPVWRPASPRETLLRASALQPEFMPEEALESDQDSFPLWGRASFGFSVPADADSADDGDGSLLYRIDAEGDVVWMCQFPLPASYWPAPFVRGRNRGTGRAVGAQD